MGLSLIFSLELKLNCFNLSSVLFQFQEGAGTGPILCLERIFSSHKQVWSVYLHIYARIFGRLSKEHNSSELRGYRKVRLGMSISPDNP